MSDLISRADAIDAVIAEGRSVDSRYLEAERIVHESDAVEALSMLPSAGQNCVLCEYYTEIETDDGIKGKCTRRTGSDKALPSADRPTVDKEYLIDLIQEAVYDGEACAKLIDLVDRPTGEWVDDCTCSICHWMHEDNNGFALITKYNYCPNCGARMRGEEE